MAASKRLTPDEEAARMLDIYGGLAPCLGEMKESLNTIQSRTQVMLTLATVTMTITGFSGPTVAKSSAFARLGLVVGLGMTLLTVVLVLVGTLRINWIGQMIGDDPRETLARMIRYRDRKTRLMVVELTTLVIGLGAYVTAFIAYLLAGLGVA